MQIAHHEMSVNSTKKSNLELSNDDDEITGGWIAGN